MKNIILIISALLFPLALAAQPFISNVVSAIGDQFVLNQSEIAPSPGSSGAHVSWDFSDQAIDGFTGTYTVKLPSEVEGSDMFPNATTVWSLDMDTIQLDSFLSFENNIFRSYGTTTVFEDINVVMIYSDPLDHFPYPIEYQDAGSDTYAGNLIGMGGEFPLTGTQSYEVDGWGTLITPYGTFENVLRITRTATETLGGGLTVLTERTQTSWYSPDYPVAVLDIVTDFSSTMGMPLDSTQTISAMVSYTPNNTVGIDDHNPENTFIIYPNPTTDQISINFEGLNQNTILKIYSTTGKLTKEVSLTANEKIDVSALSPGIYIAVIQVDGKRFTQKPFSVIR